MAKTTSRLKELFPVIKTREEILSEIRSNPARLAVFTSWSKERQEEFLNICCGARGHRILYDVYFKKVFNAE